MILEHNTRCILRKAGHPHDGEEVAVEWVSAYGTLIVQAFPPGVKDEFTVVNPEDLHPVTV